jgi:hypothetical protein
MDKARKPNISRSLLYFFPQILKVPQSQYVKTNVISVVEKKCLTFIYLHFKCKHTYLLALS